jgi:hypothetical protein
MVLESICSTIGCSNPVQDGFKSCANPSCRQLELDHQQRNQAMFQLKERLAYHRRQIIDDSITISDPLLDAAMADHDEVDLDGDIEMDDTHHGLLVEGNIEACRSKEPDHDSGKKAKALFGRRKTHNEELTVMSCGVIIGRATFYGSEAANGVLVCNIILF